MSVLVRTGRRLGFATVRIEPHLGTLDTLDATLPPGLTGEFAWRGLQRKLVAGEQSFRLQ